MQNTFKVGDRVKVVKLRHHAPSSLQMFIGKEFDVIYVNVNGVTVDDYNFFYRDEIELVKEEPIPQEVVSTPKKNIAWAVVDKSTGKVEWIRQTRSVARKLAKFQNETSTHIYQVKKIEFNFV